MSLPKIIKLSQTIWKLWPAQDFSTRGDKYIMETVRVLLNTTCLLVFIYVGVEVLQPSQPNWVTSSVVSIPNHMFTGQA